MHFGEPDVLVTQEAPDPVPGPGEAVIAVAVVPVLFLDTALRRGLGGEHFPIEPPYVPGAGVAGRVAAVGDAVDPGWIGRPVVADTGPVGAYAEQVAVAAESLIPVPESLDLRVAAALLHDGRTALGLAEAAGLHSGQRVLVVGASGGLGLLLVQLAHGAGARVVGAARGERKLELIRELGADAAVDYSEPGWAERAAEASGGGGPDVVFDGVGGEIGRAAFAITADGGQFSGHGTPSGEFTPIDGDEAARRAITVRGIEQVQFSAPDVARLVARAFAEAGAGRIRPIVGQTFAFERAADAHAAIEARTAIGKTLLASS